MTPDALAQRPIPNRTGWRWDAVSLPRPFWPQGTPENRLPQICRVIGGLVPRDLSVSSDLSVEEQSFRMLRRLLSDLMGEASVVLDEHEARVRGVFPPQTVKHLSSGIGRGLVQTIETDHLLRVGGQPLARWRTRPPPPSYWYYCQDPPGYYPYVKQCPTDWWQVVPQTPR